MILISPLNNIKLHLCNILKSKCNLPLLTRALVIYYVQFRVINSDFKEKLEGWDWNFLLCFHLKTHKLQNHFRENQKLFIIFPLIVINFLIPNFVYLFNFLEIFSRIFLYYSWLYLSVFLYQLFVIIEFYFVLFELETTNYTSYKTINYQKYLHEKDCLNFGKIIC